MTGCTLSINLSLVIQSLNRSSSVTTCTCDGECVCTVTQENTLMDILVWHDDNTVMCTLFLNVALKRKCLTLKLLNTGTSNVDSEVSKTWVRGNPHFRTSLRQNFWLFFSPKCKSPALLCFCFSRRSKIASPWFPLQKVNRIFELDFDCCREWAPLLTFYITDFLSAR